MQFLSRDELRELTGRHHRSKVIEWLQQNGYRFDEAADGWPRVLTAAVEARLMPTARQRKPTQPDFSVYGATPKKVA
jgi:hypothetical protein